MIAAAAAKAAIATTMAQTDMPHPVPQTGAHGSHGLWQGSGAHGVAGVADVHGAPGGHVAGSFG